MDKEPTQHLPQLQISTLGLAGLGTSAARIGNTPYSPPVEGGGNTLRSIERLLSEALQTEVTAHPAIKTPTIPLLRHTQRAATLTDSPEPLPPDLVAAALSARDRLLRHLLASIDMDGAVRDECSSRILESALLLQLLRKEGILPEAQQRLINYLQNAEPDGELSAIIANAALGQRDLRRASNYLATFSHDTGGRKSLLLRALFALFDLATFAEPGILKEIPYEGFARWTELSLCAIKILRAHALRREDLVTDNDRAFLTARLAGAGPGRVYEGNLLAHLLALHALFTYQPGGVLMRDGITALLRHMRADGGVPFITGQEVFITALTGTALAGSTTDRTFLTYMGDRVASWQLTNGGWGYTVDTGQSDVDDTARCMEFLAAVDATRYADVLRRGEEYLIGMTHPQRGGFPTYVRGHPSDVDMTAGAIIALSPWYERHAAVVDSALAFLLDQQQPDGTFPLAWSTSEPSVIARVLDALHRVPEPGARVAQRIPSATHNSVAYLHGSQNDDGGWGQSETDASDLLPTAQAIPVLARHGIARYVQRAIAYLLACQQPDGGFTSRPDQAGPRPLAYDFPVLADIQALNALNAVLPPITLRLPAVGTGREPLGFIPRDSAVTLKPLSIPGFYCPLPAAVHPAAAAIDQRTVAWIDRFQLYPHAVQRTRLASMECGVMAAHMCPFAPQELVQIMSDYMMWGFASDDEYSDEGPLRDRPGEVIEAWARMHRIAESPEVIIDERDRYGMALRDLRMRIDALARPEDAERFLEGVRGLMMGETRKVGYVARHQGPGLDEYVSLRMYMGGGISYATLVIPIDAIPLSAALYAERRVRALTEMTGFLITLGPDIFSYGKDRERSRDGVNPIDAIRRDRLLREGNPGSEEAALAEAVALWERVMLRFLGLRDQVNANAPAELTAYLTGLGYVIQGVIECCHSTSRYRYLNGIDGAEAIKPSGWLDQPTQNPNEPVQIPAIAWWWRV